MFNDDDFKKLIGMAVGAYIIVLVVIAGSLTATVLLLLKLFGVI